MAKGVFTTKVNPAYDDLPEVRYHFPQTYLRQAQEMVGDWIVYYEPRRQDSQDSGRAGRQCYFATARVNRVEPDPMTPNHHYAFVEDYLEFTTPVPFRIGQEYFESKLRRPDGGANMGSFRRSVRTMQEHEYQAILKAGFAEAHESLRPDDDSLLMVAEEALPYGRPEKTQIVERPFRDSAFARVIQSAYDKTCAVTGLKLVNGGGRCEIEAAHIRPVADDGPDSPRNGIALSRTIHWLFDRGILSLEDDGHILMAHELVPDQVNQMVNPDHQIILPSDARNRPHPLFLRYHRENVYRGD